MQSVTRNVGRLLAAFASALVICAQAQDKPESVASAPPGQEPVITLRLDKAPLTKVVQEIARQSRISHRVLGSEARSQAVVIYCRNQRVSAVRRAISNLLGWEWSLSTSQGSRVYTLVKGARQQRYEQVLRARYEQQYRDTLLGMIRAASDPEWKPQQGRALDFQIASESGGAVLRCAAALPPDSLNAMLQGRPHAIAARGLNGTYGELVRKAWGQVAEGRALHPNDPIRLEVARDATGRPDYLQLTVRRTQFRVGHAGFAYSEAMHDGAAGQDAQRRMLREHPELGKPLPKAPPLKWPEPPEPEPSYIGWNLRDLHRRVDRPFLADYYSAVDRGIMEETPPPLKAPANDGRRLFSALQELTEPNYAWRVEEDWVLIRYRWWYWEITRPALAR